MTLIDHELLSIALSAATPQTSFSRLVRDVSEQRRREIDFTRRCTRLREGQTGLLLWPTDLTDCLILSEAAIQTVSVTLSRRSGGACPAATAVVSAGCLPIADRAIDAAISPQQSMLTQLDPDEDVVTVLRELRRVLKPGGRFLHGGSIPLPMIPQRQLSVDKRVVSELKPAGSEQTRRSVSIARPDGSWRRLHATYRRRSFGQVEQLMKVAGFVVINVLDRYDQQTEAVSPSDASILLCERK